MDLSKTKPKARPGSSNKHLFNSWQKGDVQIKLDTSSSECSTALRPSKSLTSMQRKFKYLTKNNSKLDLRYKNIEYTPSARNPFKKSVRFQLDKSSSQSEIDSDSTLSFGESPSVSPVDSDNDKNRDKDKDKDKDDASLELLVSPNPRNIVETLPSVSLFDYLKCSDNGEEECFELPPKPSLKDRIHEMVESNKYCNTTIIIGKYKFRCQMILLKSYSSWFEKQNVGTFEFKFKESLVPSAGFREFSEWMRHQTHRFNSETIVPLTQVAVVFQVKKLLQDCWIVYSDDFFHELRAFEMYLTLLEYPLLVEQRQLMLGRIRKCFLRVVGHSSYSKLPMNDLKILLNSNSTGVNSEVEIFYSSIYWLSKNYPDSLIYIDDMLEVIRFENMPLHFLNDLLECFYLNQNEYAFESVPVLKEFFTHPQLKNRIERALSYIWLRTEYAHCSQMATFKKICMEKDLKIIEPRRWIYDPFCSFHQLSAAVPNEFDVEYDEFIQYTKRLQKYPEKKLKKIRYA